MRYKYKILQENDRFFIRRKPAGFLGLFYNYTTIEELKWSISEQGLYIWFETQYFNTFDEAVEYCYQNLYNERNPTKKD